MLLGSPGQDPRHGLRLMGRGKVFPAVAALSLALGIRANTAIFSVVDARMLKMLPVCGGLDAGTARVPLVSGTYFATLGVPASVGRTLTAGDDRVPGGHPLAALHYE